MLKNIYNQTITILSKYKRQDNGTQSDEWYKYVINNAAWYTASARSAGGSSVFIGTYITVLIPFGNGYLPYREWSALTDKSNNFTISSNDFIVLGEVTEDVTAQNIISVMQSYGDDVCTVRHRNEMHSRFGATVQLKIEGV